jgi:hypothetical protein
MRAEDYLPMAAELKKSLNLNANQQTLWSQTESRTRKLLAERKARRERLQAAALAGAQAANAELRDLARRWMRKPPQRRRGKAAARMVADCQRRPDRGPAPDGGAAGGRAVATCARCGRRQPSERPEGGGEHRGGGGGRRAAWAAA